MLETKRVLEGVPEAELKEFLELMEEYAAEDKASTSPAGKLFDYQLFSFAVGTMICENTFNVLDKFLLSNNCL